MAVLFSILLCVVSASKLIYDNEPHKLVLRGTKGLLQSSNPSLYQLAKKTEKMELEHARDR